MSRSYIPPKIGDEFNQLTIIDNPFYDGKETWVKCQCKLCNNIKLYRVQILKKAKNKSCGCIPHRATHNLKHQPIYSVWKDLRKRGICEEWSNAKIFADWALSNGWTKGINTVRPDITKPYSPDNCVFLTRKELSNKTQKEQGITIRKKIEQTNLKRFGVKNSSQHPEIRSKIEETTFKNYGCKSVISKPENIHKGILKKAELGQIKLYDGKTLTQIYKEQVKNKSYTCFVQQTRKFGLDEALTRYKNVSTLPDKLTKWLDSLNVEYKQEFCLSLGNRKFYKADIMCQNIAIECDGLKFHSDLKYIDDKNYHVKKREAFIKAGYEYLCFREDELRDKLDICKSIILNKLGRCNRIYARNCSIKQLTTKEYAEFFNNNHLMGTSNGNTLGLIYKDEIVAAIQIINRTPKEVSRYCSKLNTVVIGGLSKLLSQIQGPLSSFIDLRYGNGNSLIKNGFEHIRTSPSFKWTDFTHTFHRLKFKGNSGYEHDLIKIWDCGQAKFSKIT